MGPVARTLLLGTLLVLTLTSAVSPPPTLASAPGAVVRNARLGVSFTLPQGWFLYANRLEPPCEMAFLSGPKQGLDWHQRMVIRLLGQTHTRNEARAARRAATTFIRRSLGSATRIPVRRTFTNLAGAPAVRLTGVPGNVANVVFIVAHRGVVYQIATLESSIIQPDQQRALASLRFIPRTGRVPSC
jgi:hypothetical protein